MVKGFYVGIIFWPVLRSLSMSVGFPDILTVAHMRQGVCFGLVSVMKTNSAFLET